MKRKSSMFSVQTVLSRSEKVLGSRELEESARRELESLPRMEESPSKGAREARADANIGERREESREKRETGSSPCWYSYPGSIVYGFTTWFGGNGLSVSIVHLKMESSPRTLVKQRSLAPGWEWRMLGS